MEHVKVKGNTWYLLGRQLIPYYQVDDAHCILLDTGRVSERNDIVKTLEDLGLTPVGIILSHMHYDHHENTRFFKEKYGIPAAMPRGEAEICSTALALKNHLFCFSPGLISKTERLYNLICSIEYPIEREEKEISFQGANFGIQRSLGHSPDHICIITPDNVCYLGDALMYGEDLKRAEIPFFLDLAEAMRSQEELLTLRCDHYIAAHMGVLDASELEPVVRENIALIRRQAEMVASLIDRPMNMCECYEAINRKIGQEDEHPIWYLHMERYMRPYLDYLQDEGMVKLVKGKGSPTLAPLGWQE